MTLDSPAQPLTSSQPMRWLGNLLPFVGIMVGLFTGLTFREVIRTYNWGKAGKPEWAAHAGAIGLALGLVLGLASLGVGLWHSRWVARVSALARDRYRAWYIWTNLLGLPASLLFAFLAVWLNRVQRVPHPALWVITLGAIATFTLSGTIGYYRLEHLTRTQRDLLVQAQLAPHFLFNSLSTLKGQIATEPVEAQATADRLCRLFRELMDLGSQTSVSLARELAFVEAYLGLEQARLGERLLVNIQVPDDLENVPVPPLSLQVLVENAVRHAIAPRVEGGLLSISACRVPVGLELMVEDPGSGQSPNPGTGCGLEVLRARLARPSDLTFERTPQGHRATLILRKM